MEQRDSLLDPLQQTFETLEDKKPDNSLELFRDESGDVDLKTDLEHTEQVLASCISAESELLKRDLPNFDGYDIFLNNFMRKKVSLDRKSRGEFVNVNQKDTLDRDLNRVSNLKSLTDTRN